MFSCLHTISQKRNQTEFHLALPHSHAWQLPVSRIDQELYQVSLSTISCRTNKKLPLSRCECQIASRYMLNFVLNLLTRTQNMSLSKPGQYTFIKRNKISEFEGKKYQIVDDLLEDWKTQQIGSYKEVIEFINLLAENLCCKTLSAYSFLPKNYKHLITPLVWKALSDSLIIQAAKVYSLTLNAKHY